MIPRQFLENIASGAEFTYDEESDCGYIYLNLWNDKIYNTKAITSNILIDLTAAGDIIGMEFLNIKELIK